MPSHRALGMIGNTAGRPMAGLLTERESYGRSQTVPPGGGLPIDWLRFHRLHYRERAVKITNQKDLRRAFWEANPDLQRKAGWTQNDYPTDTRVAWCDYVYALRHDGIISEELAQRATL